MYVISLRILVDDASVLLPMACRRPNLNPVLQSKCEVAALSLPGDALERIHVEHVQTAAGPVVVMCGTVLGAASDPCLVVTHTLQTCTCVMGKHLPNLVLGPCNKIWVALQAIYWPFAPPTCPGVLAGLQIVTACTSCRLPCLNWSKLNSCRSGRPLLFQIKQLNRSYNLNP
jgi:hypothetical protein